MRRGHFLEPARSSVFYPKFMLGSGQLRWEDDLRVDDVGLFASLLSPLPGQLPCGQKPVIHQTC